MKKAKKLLAVLLAMVMLASAACLPVYAKQMSSSYGTPTRMTTNEKYYFNADKGASYILDMLDEMLNEMYLVMTWDELVGGSTLGGMVEGILDTDELNFSSIDNVVVTLYDLIDGINDLSFIGDALIGDLADLSKNGLDKSIKRGNRSDNYATGSSDMKVLFNLLQWLANNEGVLRGIVCGSYDAGLLDSTIKGIEIGGLALLEDMDTNLEVLLYRMLVDDDDTITSMPSGQTIDTALQTVVNWALVYGTGEAHDDGGYSLLGANAEPLFGEGVFDEDDVNLTTNSVYQLVNNLINGLLNGFLAPELGGIIADLVGVNEDGTIDDDDMTMFNTIIGLIEGLLVDNGADPVNWGEDTTPMGQINDLVDWLLKDGALQVFIKIDVSGLGLTDNFMSLLNDLIRIAINLLPVLGLELPDGLLPDSDLLSEVWYYKVDEETGEMSLCSKTDSEKVDQLYFTFTGERPCYAVYTSTGEVDYYRYFDTGDSVETVDTSSASYENPKFIRPYYKMSMEEVWAQIAKAAFTLFIEGPYFPEHATSMAAVLAYGSAGLAARIIPEGDWYDRLDAYYLSGYSTDPYAITDDKTVNPIAYTDDAGILPKAAMDILSSVGAYFLNSLLDLTANQRLTVLGTSFEQLLSELALWGMTTYLPMLAGEIDTTTGVVYTGTYTGTYGETRYVGTFAAETNAFIAEVYDDFSSRTVKANANWNAVYTYIDDTLLSLVPASWLPEEFFDSYNLFNNWLFGNLMKFDLQGIVSLFSANETGELNEDLITVLLRVIDRVLATVFCSEALMLPSDRSGTGSNSVFAVNTTITTLHDLLEDGDASNTNASLPTLVGRLISLLNKHKGLLCCTLFPLLLSTYERPFDKDALAMDDNFVNVLGTDMTRYRVHDLEDLLKTVTENINATQVNKTAHYSSQPGAYTTYATEAEATKAQEALGDSYNMTETVEQTADDGTVTTVYNVYRNMDEDYVLSLYSSLSDIYVDTVKVSDATSTDPAVYQFNVYQSKDFYTAAGNVETVTDAYGTKEVYSNFSYKSINYSSASAPFVTWDDGEYYFWEQEDSNPNSYYYVNFNDAIDTAESFVDSYNSFATSDLCDAYGEWFEYSIKAYAIAADVYDANADGKSVLNTSDADYTADNTLPIDGYPDAPNAMYPYYLSSDTGTVKWIDYEVDSYIEINRNSISTANYELLQMAEDYGNNEDNKVALSEPTMEHIVRYVLYCINGNDSAAALQFDITQNSDGTYTGSRQWEHLTESELNTIIDWCENQRSMYVDQDEETGDYQIYRRAYYNTASLEFLKVADDGALSAVPNTSLIQVKDSGITLYQEAQNAVYLGYLDFADALYSTRRSLYNQLDTINWRMEQAESNRATSIDTTMLDWALRITKSAYISSDSLRNLTYVGEVDGVAQYSKIYTSSSYAAFQKAYDFANSLSSTGIAQASGVTQSMVTKAYEALLAAFNGLVKYLGDADWVQYLEYLKLAETLSLTVAEGGYADHSELGITVESRQALADIIAEATAFAGDIGEEGDAYRKENFDCERQLEIDDMAASINAVILNLVYLSNPDLIIRDTSSCLKVSTDTVTDSDGKVYNYGWIIGLEEGVGLKLDYVSEKGMQINIDKGDYLGIEDGQKGLGTGSYITGYINNDPRFQYYGVLYGDLNGDARIDGTDWAIVSYYLLTGSTNNNMGKDHVFEAANADHLGEVTIADAELIKAHYNYTDTINQSTPSTGAGTATTGL